MGFLYYANEPNIITLYYTYKKEVLEIIIDAEDLTKVLAYENIRISDDKSGNRCVLLRDKKHKSFRLSRVLLNITDPKIIVEHISVNDLDYRKDNLRVTDKQRIRENIKKIRSKSGYLNVYWNKQAQKYQVLMMVKGKMMSGGFFKDPAEADKAAKEMRARLKPYSQEALDINTKK